MNLDFFFWFLKQNPMPTPIVNIMVPDAINPIIIPTNPDNDKATAKDAWNSVYCSVDNYNVFFLTLTLVLWDISLSISKNKLLNTILTNYF